MGFAISSEGQMRRAYQSLLLVWLNATSASVVTGGPLAGGQAHIALRRSGRDVRTFLRGTGLRLQNRRWVLPLERYGDLPQRTVTFMENAGTAKRRGECRIVGQAPTSRSPDPLLQRSVREIAKNSRPRQLALFLKDARCRIHLRILDATDLHRLPEDALETALRARDQRGRIVHDGAGHFIDSRDVPVADGPELRASGSARPTRRSRQRRSSDNKWDRLAAKLDELGSSGARRVVLVERLLRDPRVRSIALTCFGAACQVRGCTFTAGIPEELVESVLDVHHLVAIRAGGDNGLENLVVLCANHHRLAHRALEPGLFHAPLHDDIVIIVPGLSLLIERNLRPLRARFRAD